MQRTVILPFLPLNNLDCKLVIVVTQMKKKQIKGIESRKSCYGFMFILPWVMGFFLFFFIPLIQSFVYSISTIKITGEGIVTEFSGFGNYVYLIKEDVNYLNLLKESVISFAYSLPLIMVVSLVLALILNQKFKGRVVFRAMFFLPVIIASGVVMSVIFSTTSDSNIALGVSETMTANMFSVDDIMTSLDLPAKIAEYIQVAVSNIFDLIWSCGIQIILFIAGLQSIPTSIYEASKVEGATKWEEFWFITFPQISRITLLVGIFTMLELFTDNRNAMVKNAYTKMSAGVYDSTSAMLWIYFAIVGLIMFVVVGAYTKLLLKKWE